MKPETLLKVEFEISQIDDLLADTTPLLKLVHHKEPDTIECAALGLFLHSFYSGIENIMKFIVKDKHGELPSGNKWHKELLDMCFARNDKQTELFSEELKVVLDDYLSFRHFIRNTYSFKIKWERMAHLVLTVDTNWGHIKAEINGYTETHRQPEPPKK